MSRIKVSLATIALILGIFGSFAFTSAVSEETAVFYLNGSGQPTDEVPLSGPDCLADPDIDCHQTFTIDENRDPVSPVGSPTKGIRQ